MSVIRQSMFMVLTLILVLVGWWWCALGVALWYSFVVGGWGLLVIALLVDGYYGQLGILPLCSIGALLWCSLIEWIRPRLLMYDATNV